MGTCASNSAVHDADLILDESDTAFQVLVGPVVGTVDCHGGRILLETNVAGTLTYCYPASQHSHISSPNLYL